MRETNYNLGDRVYFWHKGENVHGYVESIRIQKGTVMESPYQSTIYYVPVSHLGLCQVFEHELTSNKSDTNYSKLDRIVSWAKICPVAKIGKRRLNMLLFYIILTVIISFIPFFFANAAACSIINNPSMDTPAIPLFMLLSIVLYGCLLLLNVLIKYYCKLSNFKKLNEISIDNVLVRKEFNILTEKEIKKICKD